MNLNARETLLVLKKIDQASFKVNNCSKENEGEKEKSHII